MGRRYLVDRAPSALRAFARQIEPRVADADLIVSPGSIATTTVRAAAPKVFWSDATFAAMVDYYPEFSGLSRRTIADGHAQESEAIASAALCVYSSQWAADSAIRDYGADPARVRVIGFGANVAAPSAASVRAMIDARSSADLELLFIGSNWHRKGGPFAAGVAKRLGARLTVIGAQPDVDEPHVRYLGWLDKTKSEQARAIEATLAASHFMVLPTRAECTPIAFCEANAFGVPVVSFDTGGVASVITHGRNGLLFDPRADEQTAADGIAAALTDAAAYADRARREFDERLNWTTATATFLAACEEVVGVERPVPALVAP